LQATQKPPPSSHRLRNMSYIIKVNIMTLTILTLALGVVFGFAASRLMDVVTGWFYRGQSEASRQLEEQVAPGGTLLIGGRKVAGWFGRQVSDEQAAKIGLTVHRSLGVLYGIIAAALVSYGAAPLLTGLLVGAAAFVIVDEAANSLLFTPPPWVYPFESHLRGIVGHLALGVILGALLSLTRLLG
jgi:hypothetical protein